MAVKEQHLYCPVCEKYIPISKWIGNGVDFNMCPGCDTKFSDAVEFDTLGKAE